MGRWSVIEPNASHGESGVETLLRTAGDYVQPSEGLRPQVMEAVREAKGLRRDRSRVIRMACLAAAVLLLLSALPWWTPNYGLRGPTTMDDVASRLKADTTYRGGNIGWRLVEIFTDVRRQQAESLRSQTDE